ncbi:SRPBCC family protein [Curtobacterium sp. ISL-83]|uniref:SRPBCC family protein n=1 Tax=Curtobacterium sp. ISL-83 TaxID=2819145 RepID=UPI001BE9F183|nr:SRPBCC family protein [Curtobacterium sp. ISL-83]MBT2503511.1 SRPBCC family protein [Curtobacterium sp. ISL-83]
MTASFRIVTELDAPPERVFAISLDIGAHERSLAGTGERAVAGTTNGAIGLGETVTFRARHLGVVWQLTSRITALEAPHRFVDEQVRGPFARFRHEHRFEPSARGTGMHPARGARMPPARGARMPPARGTRMIDEIEFRAPFGPLGRLAEVLVLRRYLERLITERNAALAAELGPADGFTAGR